MMSNIQEDSKFDHWDKWVEIELRMMVEKWGVLCDSFSVCVCWCEKV